MLQAAHRQELASLQRQHAIRVQALERELATARRQLQAAQHVSLKLALSVALKCQKYFCMQVVRS
jgi:hypothetical protein